MANNNQDPKIASNTKSINAFDKISKKILSSIDTSYTDRQIISDKDSRFQSIINREFDLPKGVSGGNVIDFIASMKPDTRSVEKNPLNLGNEDIFTQNIGDIFGYFQDVYKNKYLEMTDLKFISKFIPSIGEAVKTTLDSVVSADDISSTITRNIVLSPSISDEEKDQIMGEIERMEKSYKLPNKLKNVVYKKTLVTGSFYVYAIPYSELFTQYDDMVKSGRINKYFGFQNQNTSILKNNVDKGFNISSAKEDYADITSDTLDKAKVCLESYLTEANASKSAITNATKILGESFPNIIVDNNPVLYDAMEAADSMTEYRKAFPQNEDLKDASYVPDGTKSINSIGRSGNFSAINDTYVKYIDSKNIIPVKIFDTIVGYYHILPSAKKTKASGNNGVVSLTSSVFNSVNLTEQKKEDAINDIVQLISDGIMEKFSSKFVEKNAEFKNLIAECIIANGIVDNDYRIQFIPAQYIVPFIINEDEDGNGESILADSLFPSKLLLSLIICKMLNYMNKSGNKTIAHVYKGPVDINSTNQLQRVTRMLQESNITFNDLLSTNLVFSKFTRDSNIQLPRGKNGEKLVEFETQEGQQIDMSTDFENKLEQMAILGTGVPSVIMEYVNQADFAKQIVSANIKFAGRVSSLQADLESSTTDLYKILISNSQLSDDLKKKCLSNFSYKLPRPKVLVNSNNSEFLQTLMSTAQTVTSIYLGDKANSDPAMASVKDEMVKNIVMQNAPFFDWNSVGDIYDTARITAAEKKMAAQKEEDTSGSADDLGGGDDEDNF